MIFKGYSSLGFTHFTLFMNCIGNIKKPTSFEIILKMFSGLVLLLELKVFYQNETIKVQTKEDMTELERKLGDQQDNDSVKEMCSRCVGDKRKSAVIISFILEVLLI